MKLTVVLLFIMSGMSAQAKLSDVNIDGKGCVKGKITNVAISQSKNDHLPEVMVFVKDSKSNRKGSISYVGSSAEAAIAYVGAVGKSARLCETMLIVDAD